MDQIVVGVCVHVSNCMYSTVMTQCGSYCKSGPREEGLVHTDTTRRRVCHKQASLSAAAQRPRSALDTTARSLVRSQGGRVPHPGWARLRNNNSGTPFSFPCLFSLSFFLSFFPSSLHSFNLSFFLRVTSLAETLRGHAEGARVSNENDTALN
jgi:hypothetical protein